MAGGRRPERCDGGGGGERRGGGQEKPQQGWTARVLRDGGGMGADVAQKESSRGDGVGAMQELGKGGPNRGVPLGSSTGKGGKLENVKNSNDFSPIFQ